METDTLRTSITIGIAALTRGSTAAVHQVVQPRLDPPATTNFSLATLPPCSLRRSSWTQSMALTALFTMGRRAGQVSSPVFRYWFHVYAMRSSSERPLPSPLKTSGWFGTVLSSTATVPVSLATFATRASGPFGASGLFLPPPMKRNAVEDRTWAGFSTTSQCSHSGRSTSSFVLQDWEVRDTMNRFPPSWSLDSPTFQEYAGSGFFT